MREKLRLCKNEKVKGAKVKTVKQILAMKTAVSIPKSHAIKTLNTTYFRNIKKTKNTANFSLKRG